MALSAFTSATFLWSFISLQRISISVSVLNTRSTQRAQTSLADADHYITPILPTVKMLSLGGERLPPPPPVPPPPPKIKNKKNGLDHYLHHDLGMPPLLWRVFFAHLLILEYLDHHQNLIMSLLYYPGPLHKISPQSIHNFLSNVVHRQTDKQTNKPTLPKT